LTEVLGASAEQATGGGDGDGLVVTALLGGDGVGVSVDSLCVSGVGDLTARFDGVVNDVVVAAGVKGGVVGLSVAAALVGSVGDDLVVAAEIHCLVVGLATATAGESSSSVHQLLVAAGLLCGVVPNVRVRSSLAARLVSTVDEDVDAASLLGIIISGRATALLGGVRRKELGTTACATGTTEETPLGAAGLSGRVVRGVTFLAVFFVSTAPGLGT
jgi:hypothetical protein